MDDADFDVVLRTLAANWKTLFAQYTSLNDFNCFKIIQCIWDELREVEIALYRIYGSHARSYHLFHTIIYASSGIKALLIFANLNDADQKRVHVTLKQRISINLTLFYFNNINYELFLPSCADEAEIFTSRRDAAQEDSDEKCGYASLLVNRHAHISRQPATPTRTPPLRSAASMLVPLRRVRSPYCAESTLDGAFTRKHSPVSRLTQRQSTAGAARFPPTSAPSPPPSPRRRKATSAARFSALRSESQTQCNASPDIRN